MADNANATSFKITGLDDPDGDKLSIEITGVPKKGSVTSGNKRLEKGSIVTADQLAAATVRCRLRFDRISIELDPTTLEVLTPSDLDRLGAEVATRWQLAGVNRPVRFEPYRRGSAFLRVVSS